MRDDGRMVLGLSYITEGSKQMKVGEYLDLSPYKIEEGVYALVLEKVETFNGEPVEQIMKRVKDRDANR